MERLFKFLRCHIEPICRLSVAGYNLKIMTISYHGCVIQLITARNDTPALSSVPHIALLMTSAVSRELHYTLLFAELNRAAMLHYLHLSVYVSGSQFLDLI